MMPIIPDNGDPGDEADGEEYHAEMIIRCPGLVRTVVMDGGTGAVLAAESGGIACGEELARRL
jgi:hypothetical protein